MQAVFQDSFWLPFADGWVFPWGTNHLFGVEVVSHGRLWPTPFDTNAVASAGAPFEIVPDLTSFSYELTPSNSYSFAWSNAAIGRDTNDLVSAVLELFRNGDRSVTTNGVTAYLPRTLPFAHDGFGQDAEWVAANFTNATEILQQGYVNWVDAQVGTGLTNGLYKFTAIFPYDPPETIELFVGDYSVAVTNAGKYVFVLEKGEEYTFGTWPYDDDVEYDIQDDLVEAAPLLRSWWGGWGAPGEWTVDGGWNWLFFPTPEYLGHCCWMPTLRGTPNVVILPLEGHPWSFEALLTDFWNSESVEYLWSTPNRNATIANPTDRMITINVSDLPRWDRLDLTVGARINGTWLYSSLVAPYGSDPPPSNGVACHCPEFLDVRRDGEPMIPITLEFRTDIETNGMIRAIGWNESGVKLYYDRFGSTEVESPFVEYLEHVREWSRTFFAEGREPSVTTNAAAIGIVWDDGSSDSSDGIVIRRFTVVDRNSEPILSRLVGDSVPGVYYNPSFGKTGDIIHLAVSVAPAGVDDDKIVWRCSSGGAGFVSGNTGREVVVQMGNDDAVFKIDLKGLSTNVPALELTVRHVND